MPDYTVKLLSSNQSFQVRPNEIILDAAIRQGIQVMYTCRSGTCRTCLFEAKEGVVQQEDLDYCLITDQELAAGKRLICMSTCLSDAVLEKPLPGSRPI
jgi:ferredoxin